MNLREFVQELENKGELKTVKKEVDPYLEVAAVMAALEGNAVRFDNVKGSDMKIVGGTGSSRDLLAKSMQCTKSELLSKMANAMKNPKPLEIVENAPCQEVVEKDVDLTKYPILTHFKADGGPYIASGVVIARDPEHGINASPHRCMYYGEKNKFVMRICQRDLLLYLERAGGEIDVSMAIGVHPATILGAATRITPDTNELEVANALNPITVTKCVTNDLVVPSGCEIVLEGKITTKERHREGPFGDITGTYDLPERQEPVFIVNAITRRKDAFWHALMPGMGEHRLMMGMPREPAMYNEVNKVCKCVNARLTPGGCGWLHGIVQIKKENPDDGKKAIEAAFKGHSSMKHVIIIDEDIDFYNQDEIEWAVATRSQAGKDVDMFEGNGSSVDPSSDFQEGTDRKKTWKVGIDATKPNGKPAEEFAPVRTIKINIKDYNGE